MVKPFLAVALVFLATRAVAGGLPVAKLEPPVARDVGAVLRAAAAMRAAGDTQETWNAFDRVFEPLLDKRSTRTDAALVVLLSFYIGEHPHEDLTCELVARGRRNLPLLKYFRDHQIETTESAEKLSLEEKQSHYDSVIARIQAREKCSREP